MLYNYYKYFVGGAIIFFIEDIIKELSNNANSKVINELKKEIKHIENNQNIIIIGTGGSYITGLYIKNIMEQYKQNLCEVLKPMEALQSNLTLFSYAIICSYKIKSYEIKKVINELQSCNNIKKIITKVN